MLKAGFISLGCSKNLVDTEVMLGILAKNNIEITAEPSKADILIVNTCTFIQSAKEESITTILNMAEYKQEGKGKCRSLIIAGCMGQRYGQELLEEFPEVDAIVGTGAWSRIMEAVEATIQERKRVLITGESKEIYTALTPRIFTTPFYSAYIKIAEGCNHRCAYCAIPYVRGNYRSRTIEDIKQEVEALAEKGVKEFNIIAQDTTYYGRDIYGKPSLVELLKELVKIEKVKLTYYDGSDQESLIRSFSSGVYTTARIFPSSSNFASTLEQYGDKITYSPQDSTSYYFTFNVNRQSYNKTAKTSEEEKTSTKEAMLNKDFRQAINFAFNRHSYAAQLNGEDGADKIIRNSLVPDNFVQAGGKNFGDIAQAELVNYGEQWKGVELVDGKDTIYNPDKAKASFEKAKKELEAKGVTFPIHLDVPVEQTDTIAVQQSNSFKQSIESTLGSENVVIDVLQMTDNEKESITSQARVPAQKDYDLNSTGWAPSYQDPASYLNIMDPKTGSAMKHLGITKGKDKEVVAQLGLDEYKKLLDDAVSETNDLDKRYEKYAKAQAWLTDSSLLMPTASSGGSPVVSNVVPFSKPYSQVGIKGDPYIFKGMKLQKEIVSAKEYQAALEKWQKEKLESNSKYQKELESHVK